MAIPKLIYTPPPHNFIAPKVSANKRPVRYSASLSMYERTQNVGETYLYIPGYARAYEISNYGHVWSHYSKRLLYPLWNKCGTKLEYGLTMNGARNFLLVHNLVLSLHGTSQPSPKHHVKFLDGNRYNYDITNLDWTI